MHSYIKKLQSKSEDTRKQILMVSIISCMSIVVFIWVYSLGNHFNNKDISTQANSDLKPFKLFANSISNSYQNVSASVGSASIFKKSEEKQIDLIPVEPR